MSPQVSPAPTTCALPGSASPSACLGFGNGNTGTPERGHPSPPLPAPTPDLARECQVFCKRQIPAVPASCRDGQLGLGWGWQGAEGALARGQCLALGELV